MIKQLVFETSQGWDGWSPNRHCWFAVTGAAGWLGGALQSHICLLPRLDRFAAPGVISVQALRYTQTRADMAGSNSSFLAGIGGWGRGGGSKLLHHCFSTVMFMPLLWTKLLHAICLSTKSLYLHLSSLLTTSPAIYQKPCFGEVLQVTLNKYFPVASANISKKYPRLFNDLSISLSFVLISHISGHGANPYMMLGM